MINLSEIAEGFLNATKKAIGIADPFIEAEAKRRYMICLGCDTISKGKAMCSKSKGGCGCALSLKTRCLTCSCPKSKW